MSAKTTVTLPDRQRAFLQRKIESGAFASTDDAVVEAIERLIADDADQEFALAGFDDEIRARLDTPESEYLDHAEVFGRPPRTR
ncbi:ribbon-helix-helix domain-containing protein [Salinarimonas ramus]|uniref:Antitoxin ParD1/3/4 n=1 Tax=Salinarimonas ramus TaxID=690164 RepID=A0A917V356_9HYPH|nr:type II toxin-antitoxin system ParD family antitoxin [Salinarimonas ramus]GGK29408.1 hypothetical protein GCM10011322_14730 [Salinarimonas ramus]